MSDPVEEALRAIEAKYLPLVMEGKALMPFYPREDVAIMVAAAVAAERERCAAFVADTYLEDDDHEEVLRARFVVNEAKSGYLEAWHRPSDIADAIRNRDQE